MATTSPSPTPARRHIPAADLIGGVLLAAVMAGAFVLTRGWDHDAAVFPRGVSLGGAALGVVLVVRSLIGTREAPAVPHELETPDEQLEYVFHTATARQWLVTLGWFVGFFVSLYVLGLYPTAILYTVAYLRIQDNRSWVFSGIYAVLLTGVMYLAFSVVLTQQVPAGLFGLA
jgi:hypothetical protein